jgi:hypothetical protein
MKREKSGWIGGNDNRGVKVKIAATGDTLQGTERYGGYYNDPE